MPALLERFGDGFAVDLSSCRGSEFQDGLAKVRELPGRRFHVEPSAAEGERERKLWLLPSDPNTIERALLALEPESTDEIREWVREAKQQADAELVSLLPEDADDLLIAWANERAEWQPEYINGEPYTGLKAHQRALVSEISQSDPVRSIIADDMGLGKTIQAISIVAEYTLRHDDFGGPKLIVCPNSVKGVWEREIKRWLGDEEPVANIDGSTPKARHNQLVAAIAEDAWVIVNYEQLRTEKIEQALRNGGTKKVEVLKEPLFEKTEWAAVIGDEIHRAKNRKAKQTRGLYRTSAPIMLGLTGTPLMNSPDELWSILHWLFPKEYTSYWRFYETYVEYTEGYFGKVITGVRNPDALRFELHKRLYRRTKKQVLDLPEKQRITVPVVIGTKQRKMYTEAERGLWLEVEKAMEEGDAQATRLAEAATTGSNIYLLPNGAARTVRLRQLLSTPATLGGEDDSAKLDAVEDAILDNKHKQHVVYSEFVDTCHILADRLRRHGLTVETYTGQTDAKHERAKLEDAFQRGEIDVLVGTIGAMREGITLTAADTQHWVERSWVPGWNEQGEDRCHRIGQRDAVTIYIYEAVGTVDDGKVAPTNKLKERIVKTVLPKDEIKESIK